MKKLSVSIISVFLLLFSAFATVAGAEGFNVNAPNTGETLRNVILLSVIMAAAIIAIIVIIILRKRNKDSDGEEK